MSTKRYIIIGIFLLLLWGSFMAFLWIRGDTLTKNACQICAKTHGSDVVCSIIGETIRTRIYNANGTTYDETIIPNETAIRWQEIAEDLRKNLSRIFGE